MASHDNDDMQTSTVTISTPRFRRSRVTTLSLWDVLNDSFHRIRTGERLVIGASQDCDIVLPHPGVSRRHAAVQRKHGGIFIEDLGSKNGIMQAGRRVGEAHLATGEVVTLGAAVIMAVHSDGRLRAMHPFTSRSALMERLFHTIRRLSASGLPVLIQGESGSGKELTATALHIHGPRSHQPMVSLNCGAIPEELMLSELFGHVRGAFSGAVRDHAGVFERAGRGTLFLDEVGELSPRAQAALLRVLESGEFVPVGGEAARSAHARVVAGTNRNLREMVEEGRFRLDLYHRLAGAVVTVPPLREHLEDLPLLLSLFGAEVETIRPHHWVALLSHRWPGNVRELRNVAQRALSLGWDEAIPRVVHGGAEREEEGMRLLDLSVEILENRAELQQALIQSHHNITRLAKAIGIPRTTLWRKLRKFGLI